VVGLDREPLDAAPPDGARVVIADVFEVDAAQLLGDLCAFDVVLSDMAPDTTGVRITDQARSEALVQRAVELAERLLAERGNFVAKVFQGPELPALRARVKRMFSRVDLAKPPASRRQSSELYLVALHRK